MTQDGSIPPMDDLVHQLSLLGLTDNEARGYATLLRFGPLTGYEVAKRSGIARGNVYASLGRLIEKQAVLRTSEDQFIALPLAQFVALQQEHLTLAAEQAQRTLQRLQQSSEGAQVVSIIGTETLLQRCMTILQEAQRPVFIAGFPTELAILAPSLKPAQQRALPIEAVSFGPPSATLPDAIEHFAADDIRSAQQGRLLLLASWPHGIIGILNEDGTKTTGIWSWNRYLATVIGLYVAHERFTLQLWSRLPFALQRELAPQLTDLSSRIALAGLSPDQPLRHLLEGTLTPSVEYLKDEESTHEP
jgi:sugar-specific transcriptional regulator TrmB